MLPFEFVVETVLPSIVILSTSREVIPFKSVCVPPNEIVSEPIVSELVASFEIAIEPASCVFDIPPAFTVTAPDETEKSFALKEAIPLFESVASSPEIVVVPAASS